MNQLQKVNYQRVFDDKLKEIESAGIRPSVMLHSCCAPCSSYVLEYLTKYFDITLFYYNPNISPESEYRHRVEEQKRLIGEMCPQVKFCEGDYEPEKFYEMAKGLENEPERGERCLKCYRMRLLKTAQAAEKLGVDYFTTTLTISPQKDSAVLNLIGEQVGKETGIPYLFSDFKKKGGYKRSIELSKEYGLYRQNYCGCVFSKSSQASQAAQASQLKAQS